jgi:hypothetical protein
MKLLVWPVLWERCWFSGVDGMRMCGRYFLRFVMVWVVMQCGLGSLAGGEVPQKGGRVTEWLADLEQRFQTAFKERVVERFQKERERVRIFYQEQVEAGLADAERMRDKSSAVVFRAELEQLKREGWQMPLTDQDTTVEFLRVARRFYRDRLVETDRAWESEARQLRLEFDAALVQGARQLTTRSFVDEVRQVQAARQDLVSVWLPRMRDLHAGVRPVAIAHPGERPSREGAADTEDAQPAVAARHALEEAVKWVLEGKGALTVMKAGKKSNLERLEDLPQGRLEFPFIELDRQRFGRALLPGELLHLTHFRGVQVFKFLDFQVEPGELSFLAGWHQLQRVVLLGGRVNAQVGAWLSQCPELRELEVGHSEGLGADFFRELAAGAPKLSTLNLDGSKMEDAVVQEFAAHKKLTNLHLGGTGLSPAIFPMLSGFRNLRQFTLDVPISGLEPLSRLPLESFGCLSAEDQDFEGRLAHVGRCFPKLTSIILAGKQLSIEQAEALVMHLKNLRGLDFSGVQPAPGVARVLSKLNHLNTVVFRSPQVGDEHLEELLSIKGLKVLDLAHTGVSDEGIRKIHGGALKGVKILNLLHTRVTREAAEGLQKRVGNLSVLIGPDQD